jgi:hypothetical protein
MDCAWSQKSGKIIVSRLARDLPMNHALFWCSSANTGLSRALWKLRLHQPRLFRTHQVMLRVEGRALEIAREASAALFLERSQQFSVLLYVSRW